MQSVQPVASSSQTPVASGSSSSGKPDRLYVGNLSPTVDEYTLIQIFSKYGKITKLDFMFHKTGLLKGKPRGFAFIQFLDKDDALKAMVKLHDRLLRGRKLVVTYASSAPVDNLPLHTKGRRPTEAAKTTTLSLLKTSRRPQSAAAQIAAMEAKLANMARTKPIDEDYVPGQSRLGTPAGGSTTSLEGSPMPDLDETLGDEEGQRAALDLEKEMLAAMAGGASGSPLAGGESGPAAGPASAAITEASSSANDVAPPAAAKVPSTIRGKDESWARGLAGLPKKPSFL
ncbi:hypothetical protein IAU60_004697 [Kwoniella sp. DSM 27419]